jgi:hypothetical protein
MQNTVLNEKDVHLFLLGMLGHLAPRRTQNNMVINQLMSEYHLSQEQFYNIKIPRPLVEVIIRSQWNDV